MPHDSFNREIDYLRISVIDRCNLRCVYCMPLNGIRFLPKAELLTPSEIEAVVRAAVSVGFRKFRLTGGEPTLRLDLLEIVERIAKVPGVVELALTTNAILMRELAGPLKAAGLSRVNVHLDSLSPVTVERQMRGGTFAQIWQGIEACEAAGLTPIKINAVVTAGYNEAEVVELARLTLARDWHVRFIELMPLGGGECATLSMKRYVSNIETRRRIETALGPLFELEGASSSDEARNYGLPGGHGVIGFISPVSEPYCGTCNRMRLTADGKFHLCLLNDDELDVRRALRSARERWSRRSGANSSAGGRVETDRPSSAQRPFDPRTFDVSDRRLVQNVQVQGGRMSANLSVSGVANSDWKSTACILCECNCGVEVQLGGKDGRHLVKVRGDDAHPASKGYACEKAHRLDFYQNGPHRLTKPLRRRSDGSFEEIEWDIAIAEVAERFSALRKEHGGEAIFYYGGGGQGNHFPAVYGNTTRAALGSVHRANALSQEKTGEFWVATKMVGFYTRSDFHNCEVAFFLGKNPWMSHSIPQARVTLKEIAKDPARCLIVVDPRRTESAELADIHLQVKPGTDAWLLAAMLGVLGAGKTHCRRVAGSACEWTRRGNASLCRPADSEILRSLWRARGTGAQGGEADSVGLECGLFRGSRRADEPAFHARVLSSQAADAADRQFREEGILVRTDDDGAVYRRT